MTIISDIITGVIAGLAGALTAVISVRLQDKSRRIFDHHLKHKENFEVLKGAIGKVSSEIYPYIRVGSKEKPFILENYKVNYKYWESYIKELNIKAIPSPTSLKKNPMLLQDYALAVYNFAMDTNSDEWPNLYSNIESLEIIDQLKKLAEDVKREKSKELKDFYSNVKPFLDTVEGLLTDLDKLIHNEKIKHNCEYIK